MAHKLQNLKLREVSFVDRGANQEAHVLLFKRSGDTIAFDIPIEKLDADQHLVFGWASVVAKGGHEIVDSHGDTISVAEIEAAAYEFMQEQNREAGEMHDKMGVAKLVESAVFSEDKQKALGIDLGKTGWWTGWKVMDADVWKKVKSGEYPMFSIGGTATRQPVTKKETTMQRRTREIIYTEMQDIISKSDQPSWHMCYANNPGFQKLYAEYNDTPATPFAEFEECQQVEKIQIPGDAEYAQIQKAADHLQSLNPKLTDAEAIEKAIRTDPSLYEKYELAKRR